MIEVLHLVPSGFGDGGVVGGAERYVFELARHMAERVPTSLVTFGTHARTSHHGKLEVRIFRSQWNVRGQSNNPLSLKALAALFRPRVVHLHQKHILLSTLGGALRQALRRPVFVTDYGGGGWDLSAYTSTDRLYDGELHLSEYSRSLSPHPHPHSSVILGGVDTEKFSPGPFASHSRTVLFVGRILPHKGVDLLIKALPDSLRLEIIGQPYDHTYLEDLRTLAKGKSVTFRHGLGDEELVAAYRGAVAVVLPSLYKDTYGNETRVPELLGQTLLEGMACGIPALGTRVSSLPEVVEHERTGFVVDPNDLGDLNRRLNWLLEHPAERKQMGEAARQRVLTHFTWDQVVERCLEAYGSARA